VSTLAATCPSTLRVATRDGSLPLHVAARAGSQAVCAELIANGADVEAMNLRTGQYCWQVAGESALVKWLQAARTSPHGAASSSNGNTRARNKRPARTPEEEMERAMMIWNV
jgi:ankyrin repeat protein